MIGSLVYRHAPTDGNYWSWYRPFGVYVRWMSWPRHPFGDAWCFGFESRHAVTHGYLGYVLFG